MTLETFIQSYGYPAVTLGTFLEGELVLLMAGFLAFSGLLTFKGVVAASLLGTLVGDQLYFFLGRRYGNGLLARRPRWKHRAERVYDLLDRHYIWVVLGFRFVYGMRMITPWVLGMSRVPTLHFVLLNLVGGVVWSLAITAAGYFLGATVQWLVGEVHALQGWILAGMVAGGVAVWLYHQWRNRRSPE
ncbi:MAG TPA: DedA family protein [Gammaproteobacteria bacterium]|nr:DedA family protein [Gammaproteobacteria bacterium]